MNEVRIIEFIPNLQGPSADKVLAWHRNANIVFMSIVEDEAKQTDGWGNVWWRMLQEEGVNMKFLVIPNGRFLPVPMSHYLP